MTEIVALVTGASRGVGRGIALALLEHGATVHVSARTRTDAEAAVHPQGQGSLDSLERDASALPGRRFVWIMGADSLADFHRWQRWRDIAARIPIAVYVRPGSGRRALASRAAATLDHAQLDETDPVLLAGASPPAWIYLQGRQSTLSSSAIRAGTVTK